MSRLCGKDLNVVAKSKSSFFYIYFQPILKSEWNGVPRGYKIYYKMKDNSTNFTVVDLDNGMNMDSAILSNLEEWMEYEVKMLAYNEVGDSPFSSVTVERTRESGKRIANWMGNGENAGDQHFQLFLLF